MLVNASADTPELISADTLTGRIGARLWGTGAWLLWRQPREGDPARMKASLNPDVFDMIRATPTRGIKDRGDRLEIGGVPVPKKGSRLAKKNLTPKEDIKAYGREEASSPLQGQPAESEVGREAVKSIEQGSSPDDLLLSFTLRELNLPAQVLDLAAMPIGAADQLKALYDWDSIQPTLDVRCDNAQAPTSSTSELYSTFQAFLPHLTDLIEAHGLDSLVKGTGLDEVEAALLAHIEWVSLAKRRPGWRDTRDPFVLAIMVQSLSLPAGQLKAVLATMILKLLRLASRGCSSTKVGHKPAIQPTTIDWAFIEATTAVSSTPLEEANRRNLILDLAQAWGLPVSEVRRVGQRVVLLAVSNALGDKRNYRDELLKQLEAAARERVLGQLWREVLNSFADTAGGLELLGLILSKTEPGARKFVEAVCRLLNQPGSTIVWDPFGGIPLPSFSLDHREMCFLRLKTVDDNGIEDPSEPEILRLDQKQFTFFNELSKEANKCVPDEYDLFSVKDAGRRMALEARAW